MNGAYTQKLIKSYYFFNIVPSSPPQKVQCTPMSSTSLLINWSPPPVSEMNGVLKEYRVFYRPLREWKGNTTNILVSLCYLTVNLN